MKKLLAFVLAVSWSGAALAQAPDVPRAPAPAPAPTYDPWLAPPGSRPPAAAMTPEAQAAAVAAQEGLRPDAAGLMLQFYRPRRLATAGAGASYVFTVGEVQRVATETAVLDSYSSLTGSHELDRYRVPRPGPGPGILLAGGAAVAVVAGEVALICAAGNTASGLNGERGSSCNAGVAGAIALGGAVAAVVGLVMVSQASAGTSDPNLHRIPAGQVDEIVRRYNLALLKRAAELVRAGDVAGLLASTSPRPRPPAPPRLSVRLTGLALTF